MLPSLEVLPDKLVCHHEVLAPLSFSFKPCCLHAAGVNLAPLMQPWKVLKLWRRVGVRMFVMCIVHSCHGDYQLKS